MFRQLYDRLELTIPTEVEICFSFIVTSAIYPVSTENVARVPVRAEKENLNTYKVPKSASMKYMIGFTIILRN